VDQLIPSPQSSGGLNNITSQGILEWLTVIWAPKRIQSSFTTMLDLQTALVFMMFKFNKTFQNRAPELGGDGLLSGLETELWKIGREQLFLSSGGCTGLGCNGASLMKGDTICLLERCYVPMILRKQRYVYVLISGCVLGAFVTWPSWQPILLSAFLRPFGKEFCVA
jgi:hypothetical protein